MARILLIDDDDALRTVLREILVHFGHAVIEARNGTEGLALFKQAPADLLITDIVMPEKDGIEVLMAIRDTHPPLKIIAISGAGPHGGGDYLALARLMSAAKVLQKPFSADALMGAINDLLPGGV